MFICGSNSSNEWISQNLWDIIHLNTAVKRGNQANLAGEKSSQIWMLTLDCGKENSVLNPNTLLTS